MVVISLFSSCDRKFVACHFALFMTRMYDCECDACKNPKIDSSACCLQTNSSILRTASTLPMKPSMARLKRPIQLQKVQVRRADPLPVKQLL